ncbi:hypothetical protein MNB_SV-15-746 [hydrothermal vent metagenome]|uniref:Alginate export domain-containing protein n=1 Tax=hydrothermal vent metagenome TaxID=652676 RepID=A0A1W1EKQ6_9ZZZZ
MIRIGLSTLLLTTLFLQGAVDDDMSGFGDDEVVESNITTSEEESKPLIEGLTGEITQGVVYRLNNKTTHDDISSFKSSLFLDYEHKFDNGIRFKINAKGYYDFNSYIDALQDEVEVYDAFVEGKISENFDYKIGRQVVVWGRSDTIRVTDVLNPLDNRTPAFTDIKDLRLPVNMAKFDYFMGDWRVSAMAILEQRFSKNPPFGSDFNPSSIKAPADKDYDDITYAMSVTGEFSGWDISFYGADIRNDAQKINHDKIKMFGGAINILQGSWLFKGELAYFDGLKYISTANKEFKRLDILLGLEYNGITDTVLSYDIVKRTISDYDNRLLLEFNPLEEDTYQHAFRVTSEFFNASLKANYLISLYGKSGNKGGFQRLWGEYEISDGINASFGVVDYIGGSKMFDMIEDNDKVFVDISYSF